jgi:hypothetical protein
MRVTDARVPILQFLIIARSEATKQSVAVLRARLLDCFASLAMTTRHGTTGRS